MIRFLAFTILISLPFLPQLSAQCSISNVEITLLGCDDEDFFDIEVMFDYENVNDAGFQVIGNGANYGVFSYDELPATISGLTGDCITNFEFIVRDVTNPACSAIAEFGTVCCGTECELTVIDFEPSSCNGDGSTTSVSFDITYSGVQDPQNIDVYGAEGYLEVVPFESFPVTIAEIPTGSDDLSLIIVCSEGTDCCDTISYTNPCVCSISNTSSTIVDCDETSATYFVTVDFDYNMASDSFLLGYDVNLLGVFSYDELPLTVGPISFSMNDVEFLVVDQANALCFDAIPVGIVNDCNTDCFAFNLVAEAYACQGDSYNIDFEFEGENINPGDLFIAELDGIVIDTFPYGAPFYTLPGVTTDCESASTLSISFIEDELCQDFFVFDEPFCCECLFSNFEAEVECSAGTINIAFNTSADFGDGTYVISIDGVIVHTADYTESEPIPLGNLSNGTYSINMSDANDINCSETIPLVIDCVSDSCSIGEVVYEFHLLCEGDSIMLDLEISDSEAVSDSFFVLIDGAFVGSYSYEPSFITLGPLVLDCEVDHTLVIIDNENTDCTQSVTIADTPCCDECLWISSNYIYTCDDGEIILTLSDIIALNASDQYTVTVDGSVLDTFMYGEGITVDVITGTSEIQTLTLTDLADSSCFVVYDEGIFCIQDCFLEVVSSEVDTCYDNTYDYLIDIEFVDGNDSFQVFVGAEPPITFSYDDVPFILEGLSTSETYTILISDLEDDTCIDTLLLEPITCETSTNDNQEITSVNIYQANGQLIIENISDAALLSLYNTNGQNVLQTEYKNGDFVDLEKLVMGLYIVNILEGGRSYSKLIFIKK